MMKYAHIYTLLLMFVFYTSCAAQNKTGLSKTDSKDTLTAYGPKRITRNVIQDRNGNIWMASWEGVFKYDGKSFTNITGKVSTARFFSVLEDRKGNLWFGSIGSGVYRYDGKSFKNFTSKDGLAGDAVTCIYEDKTGNIWFATGNGASRYDGRDFKNFKMTAAPAHTDADSTHVSIYQQTIPEDNSMQNDVNAIIEDKAGKLWFGTRGYARIYDGKTFTMVTNNDGKPFANVRSIIKDKKGNIWLGGYDGLWRYDGSTFTNFTKNFVGFIFEDRKGNIWTSSQETEYGINGSFTTIPPNFEVRPQGSWVLSRYDGKSLSDKKPTVTEIAHNPMIFGILEAKDGNIWFGAIDGVHRYDGMNISDFKNEK